MVNTPNAESEQSKTITLRQKSARSENTFSTVNMHHDGDKFKILMNLPTEKQRRKATTESDFISTKLKARNSVDNCAATLWGKA